MHADQWTQLILLIIALAIVIPFIGIYWARLALTNGQQPHLYFLLGGFERLSYLLGGIDPHKEMTWTQYLKSMLLFNGLGFIILFLLLKFQSYLPFNPQGMQDLSWPLALNIAVSFATGTNWQSYAGETTLSYGSQMMGLTVQNFLSTATGSAILMAFIRGIIRSTSPTIGNFWADVVRSIIYLLLPLSIMLSLFYISQGVIQSLYPYLSITTLEGHSQTLPLGPVASQAAIKILGNNGGGFFHVNSAHPFENPNAFSNFVQTTVLAGLPLGIIYAYGLMIQSKKHAFLLFIVMLCLFFAGLFVAQYAEHQHNPLIEAYPLWEGKEMRFGISQSINWTALATTSSNGSVNAMYESLSPLAGGIALMNIIHCTSMLGGVGVGLCMTLMYVFFAVFLCSLMAGHLPEYRGKVIDKRDAGWVMLAVVTPNLLVLIGAGITCLFPQALSNIAASGPHGLTELLYNFSSAAFNNGSAFAGMYANTDYYNLVLAVIMALGRLSILVPSVALAGSLGAKRLATQSFVTLSTNSFLFGIFLLALIILFNMLTFFPVLSLGPVAGHLLMLKS